MSTAREWWQDFFPGPWGDIQAQGLFQHEETAAETDFIVSALGLGAGDKLLDVACGTGRHCVALAERGIDVTGVDFNAAALGVAEKAAADRGVSARFIEQDMRKIVWDREFDAAINFWSSFGYFENEGDDLEVARRVAAALRPGGRFLLNLTVIESLLPVFRPRRWQWLDDERTQRCLEETRFDIETGRVEADWTFIRDGTIETAHSSLRLYSYRELCALLRDTGFRHFESFDGTTDEPFALGSTRLSLVASLDGGR